MKGLAIQALFCSMLFFLCAGCGTTRPQKPEAATDDYFKRMIVSAGAAFDRGDIERAAVLYENAWRRARVMDRPEAMSTAAYNLALCRISLGQPAEGRKLLQEVRHEQARSKLAITDALLIEAEAARLMDDTEGAWSISEEALSRLKGGRYREQRLQAHALRSIIASEREDLESAEDELAEARNNLRRDTPFVLRARLAEAEGLVRSAALEPLEAAAAFDSEAAFYRDAGRFAEMAAALVRAARASQEGESYEAAADRFYRAARHYAAAGRYAEALRVMQQAMASLEKLDEEGMEVQRSLHLIETISDSVKNPGNDD